MRKTVLLLSMLLVTSISYAQRLGKMIVGDGECTYDTLEHRRVAPGAVYTRLQFNNISENGALRKMRVHYVTVDITNPYNSFATYLSNDKYYGMNKQHQQVQFEKNRGLKPVVSMTGGAFWQSAIHSETMEGNEMQGSVVSNGVIKYENSDSGRKFYVDGLAHIGNTRFVASVAKGNEAYTIAQVNHYRDHSDQNQLITLFANGIPMSKCSDAAKNNGMDVRIKLLDAKHVKTGKTSCKVVEVMHGCGHAIGEGEAILSGVGNAAAFLSTLAVGDVVELDVAYLDAAGRDIDMQQQVFRFGNYGISAGVITPSPWENYADCLLGCSQDGKTMYMFDFENSPESDASVNSFLQCMQQLGVYDAMGLDGGPSAEMTIDGSFVTTNAVDGFEGRYIPGGLMLYSTAPFDDVVADVDVMNESSISLKVGQQFAPTMYGFNQYGEMISNDAKRNSGVVISCIGEIGEILEDGCSFLATTAGSGALNIEVKSTGRKYSIPVVVKDDYRVEIEPNYLFTGEGRECQLQATYSKNGERLDVDPDKVKWSFYDNGAVVSCENGLVVPGINGTTIVCAEYAGVIDTIFVDVENLMEEVDCLDLTRKLEYGDVDNIHIPSVPYSFALDVKANSKGRITFEYLLGETLVTVETDMLAKDSVWHYEAIIDRDDIGTYPVTLKSISSTGRYYCSKLVAYYSESYEEKELDIASVECVNASNLVLHVGDVFIPQLETYNINGDMISDDAKGSDGLILSCTESIGEMSSDGYTFTAKKCGEGFIYVKIKSTGSVLSIPVKVIEGNGIQINTHYLFTGEGCCYQLDVVASIDGTVSKVTPEDVIWTTNDPSVVLKCENGYIVPGHDGFAEVYAEYLSYRDTVVVHVENLESSVYAISMSYAIDEGCVENTRIPSLPMGLLLEAKAVTDGYMRLVYTMGADTCVVETEKMNAGETWRYNVEFDRSVMNAFPVKIVSLTGSSSPYCQKIKVYYAPKKTGDLNDDGEITIADIKFMLSCYLGEQVEIYSSPDIDEDGIVSINDIVRLLNLYLDR